MKDIINSLARMVDISSVKAESKIDEIYHMAKVAKHFNFICAFAMPCYTQLLVDELSEFNEINVGGVVGFPSGAETTSIKVAEAKELLKMGVNELDMVINVGMLKNKQYDEVYNDIRAVVECADGFPVKCILETPYLCDDEIRRGAEIAVRAGVTYVKTSTGWTPKPTTVENIKVIKSEIGNSALIKAAGGIRTLDTFNAMVEAGASRVGIGTQSAISIMKEAYERNGLLWTCEDNL